MYTKGVPFRCPLDEDPIFDQTTNKGPILRRETWAHAAYTDEVPARTGISKCK
jgi:hypothetical protein